VVAGHAVAPPDRWLLCYEHGGHGYHYHVVLLERTVSGSRVIEAGQWLPPAEEIGEAVRFESVVEGLRTGEVAHDNHW